AHSRGRVGAAKGGVRRRARARRAARPPRQPRGAPRRPGAPRPRRAGPQRAGAARPAAPGTPSPERQRDHSPPRTGWVALVAKPAVRLQVVEVGIFVGLALL